MNYQIASKTATGTKKDKYKSNGDWYGWLERDNCVVLAVADGVGECASDYRASHTACDRFIEKCASALNRDEELDESALHRFCVEIDPVLAVDNDKACFSAAVWYTNTHQVVWLNVGDTRIYKGNRVGVMTQMTVDDRAVENAESNDPKYGKYRTDHGALVPNVGVKYALGDGLFGFHTGSFEFGPGESMVLCSDGMYNSSSFDVDMARLVDAADMDEAVKRINTTSTDDATLLVLRRNMTVEAGLEEIMGNFDDYQKTMPFNALTERFCKALESIMNTGADVDQIAAAAAFMKQHQLYPDKERIKGLFNGAVSLLNAMPQGEERQRFNAACIDLKEILEHVHKQPTLL